MPPLLDKSIKHCNKLVLQKSLDLQLSGSQNRVKKSTPAWTRPQSADNCTAITRRNKLAARFNLLHTEEDQDLFRNLGATYTVSSSNLLQSLMGSSSIDVPLDSDISLTPSPRLTKAKEDIEDFSKDRSDGYVNSQESNDDSKKRDKLKDEKCLKSEKGSNSSLVPGLEPGLVSKPPLPPTAEQKTMKYNSCSWSSLTEAEGTTSSSAEKAMNDDDIINLKFQRWFPDSVLNTSSYSSIDEDRISKVNIDMKHLFTNTIDENKSVHMEATDSESLAGSRNSLSEGELSEDSGVKPKTKKNQKGEKGKKYVSSSSSFNQGKETVKVNKSSSVREKRVISKSYVRNSKEKPKLSQSLSDKDLSRKHVDASKTGSMKTNKTAQKKPNINDKTSSNIRQLSDVSNIPDNYVEISNRKSANTEEYNYEKGLQASTENFPPFSFADYDLIRPISHTRPSTSTTNFSNNGNLLYNSSTPVNCVIGTNGNFSDNSSKDKYYFHSVQGAGTKHDERVKYSDIESNVNNEKKLVPSISVTDLSAEVGSKSKDVPDRLTVDDTEKNYLVVPRDAAIGEIEISSNLINNHSYLNQSQSHFNRDNMNSPLQDNFFPQAEFANGPVTSSSRSIVANFHREEDGMRKFFQTRVAVSECLVETVQGEARKGVGKIIHNNSVLNTSSYEHYNSGNVSDLRKNGEDFNATHTDRNEKPQTSCERFRVPEQSNNGANNTASFDNYPFPPSGQNSNSFLGLMNQNTLPENQVYRPRDFDVYKQKDQNAFGKLHDINEVPERDNDFIGTYDDIVDILKVLEQEEERQTTVNNSNNSGSVTNISQNTGVLEGSTETSQAILSYLDEVNRNSEITLQRNPQPKLTNDKPVFQMDNRGDSRRGRLGELLSIPSPELAQCVMNLSLELEENVEAKKATEEQLVSVKASFEKYKSETKAALERHQKFIDQLINEKKQLSDKCATVMKDMECKQAQAIKVLEDRHAVELKKACEKQAATEKIKRERWIDLKTKKIKELTVKGLEPELNRMANVHQEELSELRRAHQHQMDEAEKAAARRLASARMQMEADKEAALMQERDMMRRRLEHETTEMEKSYQDQRKRMINELRAEREQMQRENANIILEKERELLQKLEKITQESHEKYEQQEKRFQEEVERVRNVMEAEKEAWLTRQKTLNCEKEKQIREELKRERDRHIEVAIRKLESEASGREEAAENKLKREKERFECELKDMEKAHNDVRDKLKQARTDLSLAEQQSSRLASDLQQAMGEIESLKLITEKLAREKHELQLLGEEETRKRVAGLERELAQARLALREQINTVQNEKERELQQVYARVREAITKKDDTISLMAKERDTALEQCAHLEKLMEQQRKEIIKRKAK
ncbi:centrosomal protein of 131 kDa-like [Nilaparvata lugens]|uniref:centrosomal protein of 131 kDa-like n=1 Tax=Nilaparvata lugens TaxID=108931 RepID=UPI00193DBA99|nr:centrosomal protein of 131 kDa-like [Nilaparvata lugens]